MNIAARIPTMTHASFNELLPKMQTGQMIIYHVGSLMHDRLLGPHFQTVHGVALAASDAYKRGEVTLVQHKIAPLEFEYIAIKRDPALLGGKDRPNKSARRSPSSPAPV